MDRARLDDLARQHMEVGGGICGECENDWPCDVALLLEHNEQLTADLEAARTREGALVAALPDPAKLWSLAEWLEMKYPGDPNPEIQDDLRAWAKAIYATDPVKYGAYWVQAICDEEARAALAAAAEGKTDG